MDTRGAQRPTSSQFRAASTPRQRNLQIDPDSNRERRAVTNFVGLRCVWGVDLLLEAVARSAALSKPYLRGENAFFEVLPL